MFSARKITRPYCRTSLEILGNAKDVAFKDLKHKGRRPGCQNIELRDIGAYDTCKSGCRYCYANKNPQKALENCRFHDSASPLLPGHVKDSDTILPGVQWSFRKKYDIS